MKYTLIKSKKQQKDYQLLLDEFLAKGKKAPKDEVEMLQLLLHTYAEKNDPFLQCDPVEVLRLCMKRNALKQKDLVALLGVSKGLVSDILSYKKGLSKESIRILAAHFEVRQEVFNRAYPLRS